jgi:hypothetical protein
MGMAAAAHTARICASEYCLTAAYRESSCPGGFAMVVSSSRYPGPPYVVQRRHASRHRYQVHLPNGLSLYTRWIFVGVHLVEHALCEVG